MNNKKNIKIPIPLIVFAYILYWPAGLLLTVLYFVNKKNQVQENSENRDAGTVGTDNQQATQTYGQQSYQSSSEAVKDSYQNTEAKKQQKTNSKHLSKLSRTLGISSIVSAALSAITLLGTLTDFNGWSELLWPLAFGLIAVGLNCCQKYVNERDVRYARILAMIGSRKSFNLTKLAAASGQKLNKVRKDVQALINRGAFGENAYIDLGTNNFMRSSEAEPDEPEAFDYHVVYGNLFAKEKDDENYNDGKTSDQSNSFGTILHEIRRLNDEIEDLSVSERIDKIEGHTRNIFDYVSDHPEAMPQIRTFMNYYLPTTLKLLESYSRIERIGVAGENMKKSKKDIEEILDMLVVGFEQQVDQLFSHETIDISSDIHVLEQMMQKDGLDGKNTFAGFDLGSGGTAAQSEPQK